MPRSSGAASATCSTSAALAPAQRSRPMAEHPAGGKPAARTAPGAVGEGRRAVGHAGQVGVGDLADADLVEPAAGSCRATTPSRRSPSVLSLTTVTGR